MSSHDDVRFSVCRRPIMPRHMLPPLPLRRYATLLLYVAADVAVHAYCRWPDGADD